ncbi:MAG: hypothetical protein AAF936_18175 [Pseudomonadota bacterium]
MHLFKRLISIGAAAAFTVTTGFAQDGPSMSMVTLLEVTPAKEQQFDSAWMTIKEIATENDYPYTEFVGGMRNERWIATPINSYADVDAVFAAREAVTEAGGKKYKKAIASFQDALMTSHTFFTQRDADLSYSPEGSEPGPFMEIDSFQYQYGADEEMESILADYKALMESKQSPYAYEVNWDGLGVEGNSITIISFAENAVAMAQANAAINEMLEGDEAAEALFARFLAISGGSETMHSVFNPEATINMPSPE